jgi:hypothetical protein
MIKSILLYVYTSLYSPDIQNGEKILARSNSAYFIALDPRGHCAEKKSLPNKML